MLGLKVPSGTKIWSNDWDARLPIWNNHIWTYIWTRHRQNGFHCIHTAQMIVHEISIPFGVLSTRHTNWHLSAKQKSQNYKQNMTSAKTIESEQQTKHDIGWSISGEVLLVCWLYRLSKEVIAWVAFIHFSTSNEEPHNKPGLCLAKYCAPPHCLGIISQCNWALS